MAQNKWDSNNIPSQKGRVAIITGSSSGIGYETARVLASKNATVIIAVRNIDKGENAANKIRSLYRESNVVVMELDLADLKSVRTFAEAFIKRFTRLDLLINNAGVMIPPYGKTKDGFELQLGTNHLGHFALTGLLLKALENTKGSRIVNVSSGIHKIGNINFDDLTWEKRPYKAMKAYGDSKIANLYFNYELKRRLKQLNSGITVAASHPGWTSTELQRHSGVMNFMNQFFAQKINMGALPTLYAATFKDVASGDFFGPSGWQEMRGYPKKVDSNDLSKNEKIAARLWQVSEQLTDVNFLSD